MSKRFPHLDTKGPARSKDLLAGIVDGTYADVQGNLTQEQEELGWKNIGAARGAVGQLIKDPTLAYKYSQNQDRWRVWMGMANGTLIMGSRLGTQIHHSAMVMREIVEALAPSRIHGPGVDEQLAAGHARLELRKAAAMQQIAGTAWKMLVDYPVQTPRLANMAIFMQDHAKLGGTHATAVEEAVRSARYNSTTGSKPRPAPAAQLNIFNS